MSEKNFTEAERDAMKAKLAESKTKKSRAKKSPEEARAEGAAEVRAKIADMPDEDRMLGEKFDTAAQLDDGSVWPTAYAVTALSQADLTFLADRVRQAAG